MMAADALEVKLAKIKDHLSNFVVKDITSPRSKNVEEKINDDNKKISGCVTSDRFSYNERVSSYGPCMWTINEISPLELARLGWKAAEKNVLQCITCHAIISGELPDKSDPEAYDMFLDVLKNRLIIGHKDACRWGQNHSPVDFSLPPLIENSEDLRNMTNHAHTMASLNSALPHFDHIKLEQEIGVDSEILEGLFSTNEPIDEVKTSAALLILTGWVRSEGAYLKCTICQRSVGLWGFTTRADNFRHANKNTETDEAMDGDQGKSCNEKEDVDASGPSGANRSKRKRNNSQDNQTSQDSQNEEDDLLRNDSSDSEQSDVDGEMEKSLLEGKIDEYNKLMDKHSADKAKKQNSEDRKKERKKSLRSSDLKREQDMNNKNKKRKRGEESPLLIGQSPGSPVKKIEKKYPFHPLEEHRPWCSWITEIVIDQDGDQTASTDRGSDLSAIQRAINRKNSQDISLDMSGYNTDRTIQTVPGYQFFIQQIYEVLEMAAEPQWSNTEKYSMNLDGIRNIRSMLYDSWTASEATSTDAEDVAEK